MMPASPRPWVMRIVRQPLTENVYYIRIDDANGNKVAALSTHASVGGRGLEQATADARLIVTLANSGTADSIEREAAGRVAAPVEIPEAERTAAGETRKLL